MVIDRARVTYAQKIADNPKEVALMTIIITRSLEAPLTNQISITPSLKLIRSSSKGFIVGAKRRV